MKKILFVIAISFLAFTNFSCEKEKSSKAGEIKPVALTEKQKLVISTSNSFGFDFFGKVFELSGSDQNLMVSPLSVSMALGMTRNGANGSTLDGMNTALGFQGMEEQEINDSYKYILETFYALDPYVKVQIANSIWHSHTFNAEPDFLNTNQQYFNATINPLNFSESGASDVINNWVKEKTNNLIPKIIDQIPADAVMYLVNAVYFKGIWKYQFDKAKTDEKEFKVADDNIITVPTMIQETNLSWLSGSGFQAIELPYSQGNFTMTVLLPDDNKTLADVISQLTPENWSAWKSQFRQINMQLQLPRFKYEYEEKNIKPVLSTLGMAEAFNPDAADFTRINPSGGLYLSRVLHKTYIDNNEEGTEAAAVTAVEVGVTSVDPNQPYHFIVNRPFVYFIQEKTSGTILFIGTVINPAL